MQCGDQFGKYAGWQGKQLPESFLRVRKIKVRNEVIITETPQPGAVNIHHIHRSCNVRHSGCVVKVSLMKCLKAKQVGGRSSSGSAAFHLLGSGGCDI